MISEKSKLFFLWNASLILLIPISCFFIPLKTVFLFEGDNIVYLIYFIDVLFLIDVGIRFFVTFTEDGIEITDRKKIAVKYLKSYFIFDLIANIPIWYSFNNDISSVWLVFPVFRLFRLIKLIQILNVWKNMLWNLNAYLRIIKFVLVIGIVIHWIASAWFLIVRLDGFPDDSWLALSRFAGNSPLSHYIYSMYWTIITMTTVGYGDITPVRDIEMVFTMGIALLGASSYAFIIGNLASLFSNLNAARTAYSNKVQAVNNYLFQRNVPNDINNKIREYYKYLWDKFKGHEENHFFDDIPVQFRLDVLHHLTKEIINKIPLFKNLSDSLRDALILSLKHQTYPPECFVIREGQPGGEIFFVATGELKLITNSDTEYKNFISGDYFGEMSLILNEKRTASVKSISYCDIFCLYKEDYIRIKAEYPEFKDVLKTISTNQSETRSEFIMDHIIL